MLIIRLSLLITILEKLELKADIMITTFICQDYPVRFKSLRSVPLVVFYIGNLNCLEQTFVVISGIGCLNYYSKRVAKIITREKNLLTCAQNYNYQFTQFGRCVIIYSDYNQLPLGYKVDIAFSFGLDLSIDDEISLLAAIATTCYVLADSRASEQYKLVNAMLDNNKQVYVLAGSIFDQISVFPNFLIEEGADLITYQNVYKI